MSSTNGRPDLSAITKSSTDTPATDRRARAVNKDLALMNQLVGQDLFLSFPFPKWSVAMFLTEPRISFSKFPVSSCQAALFHARVDGMRSGAMSLHASLLRSYSRVAASLPETQLLEIARAWRNPNLGVARGEIISIATPEVIISVHLRSQAVRLHEEAAEMASHPTSRCERIWA